MVHFRIKSPASRTLVPERGRFSGHISLTRSAHPRRVFISWDERSYEMKKKLQAAKAAGARMVIVSA